MLLNLLVIKTKDIEQLTKFYSLLGLEFEYHKHGNGQFHYSAEISNLIFEIYPLNGSQAQPDKTTRLGFKIENLEQKIEEIQNKGFRVISPPQNSDFGYRAVIEDLDGRKVELTEE